MVNVIFTNKFEREFRKVDSFIKIKVKKQISKIIQNPEIGKLLKFDLKGERTIYVKPYRIIYSLDKDTIFFLRFEHRKKVY